MDSHALVAADRVSKTHAETQAAIDRILDERANGPRALTKPLYTEYHPRDGGPVRMLKIIDIKHDPLEPPRHKIVSAPQIEDPLDVPILRSDVVVTEQDKLDWKIPRVQSSWGNPGYKMVSFDKRVAQDFRSRQRAPVPGQRAGQLAAALDQAESEIRAQQELEDLERAQQLEQSASVASAYLERKARRVRGQGGPREGPRDRAPQKRSRSPQEQYDSRLYSKARPATTGPYDGPLFAAQAVSEMYTPNGEGVEFEKD